MPTTWAGVIRPPVADRANRPLRGRGSPAGRCAPLAHVLPHQGNLRAHKFALHAQAPRLNPNGQQPVGDPIVPRPWGLPHRGPRVVAELAMLKAPFGRFSRHSSLLLHKPNPLRWASVCLAMCRYIARLGCFQRGATPLFGRLGEGAGRGNRNPLPAVSLVS